MNIYLVQHADAKSEKEDPSRPLSEKGLQDIKRIASYVATLNIAVHKIFHSTKLRARQTAEVLSENLKPKGSISEADGLFPLDDPNIWAERLRNINEDSVIIGHLPHLGKLASLLLCGDVNKNIVSFRMAGIVCLKRNESGAWSLEWLLIPELIEEKNVGPCDGL